jgi:ketosteroid isomerase-like protein
MRHFILMLVVAGALALTAGAQPLTLDQKRGAEEVIATFAKWAQAVRDRDAASLDKIFGEDLFVTLSDGRTRGKKEELAAIGADPSVKPVSIVNEGLEVRMMGDAAVVTGQTRMRFMRDKTEFPVNLRFTSAWARRDGRWQLVVLQIANTAAQAAAPKPAGQ